MSTTLEQQLHEQYAINNNSGMSSVAAILVGMFGALGGYAYVYLNTVNDNSGCCNQTVFDTTDLLYAAIAVLIILTIMFHICIRQGFSQRFEQFVTIAIRYKHYEKNFISAYLGEEAIFPKKYTPFGKKGLDKVQGLYGQFLYISLILFICIVASLLRFESQDMLSVYRFIDVVSGAAFAFCAYLFSAEAKESRCCFFVLFSLCIYLLFLIWYNHPSAFANHYNEINALFFIITFCVVVEICHYKILAKKYSELERHYHYIYSSLMKGNIPPTDSPKFIRRILISIIHIPNNNENKTL